MVVLIVYSFNSSRLVTVWAGWSTKWYGELFRDEQIMNAVGRSLQVAFYSASTAVVLGMLASIVIVRFRRFRGRTLFSGMITAPLVMPDVIIGLSMLLLFVAMAQSIGWPPQRGLLTVWIAHTTFCVAYSTVVISSRLREMDQSLEEAALDLGATPVRAFFLVTLPIIAPSILSAWLLSFTLSLDDVVIASFVTGPGATTLPIEVFSSVKLGVTPKINALATIIIGVVSLVAFGSWYVSRRIDERNRAAARMAAEA
ncbi:ABC transporter permease subunit [Saccharospirillum salsuginis]|nr:ABC transporter permease subunit [Saccharospirillum salsuginis]